jgi:hypothetical protein
MMYHYKPPGQDWWGLGATLVISVLCLIAVLDSLSGIGVIRESADILSQFR